MFPAASVIRVSASGGGLSDWAFAATGCGPCGLVILVSRRRAGRERGWFESVDAAGNPVASWARQYRRSRNAYSLACSLVRCWFVSIGVAHAVTASRSGIAPVWA